MLTELDLERRACADLPIDEAMRIFFPAVGPAVTRRKGPDPYQAARAICDACPVRRPCLAAFLTLEDGFVGGHTPSERHAIRDRREPVVRFHRQRSA